MQPNPNYVELSLYIIGTPILIGLNRNPTVATMNYFILIQALFANNQWLWSCDQTLNSNFTAWLEPSGNQHAFFQLTPIICNGLFTAE